LAGLKRKYSSKANAKGWQVDEDAILDFLHILFQPDKIADSPYQVRMGSLGLKY